MTEDQMAALVIWGPPAVFAALIGLVALFRRLALRFTWHTSNEK